MLSIHSNLQQAHNRYMRLRNNYDYLQALVNNALTWQSSCVIANNARKQQKLFVQGYNLEVHDVMKYTQKHRATKCYRRLRNNYACLQALVNNKQSTRENIVPRMLLIISRASQV